MKYEVVTYGNEILRKKAERVEDPASLRDLAADMLTTMHENNGLGLAAEQIGRSEAIVVVDVPAECDVNEDTGELDNPGLTMPLVMINPEILETSGSSTCKEGCLSFPEIFVPVKRAEEVTASYVDTDGQSHTITSRGLVSRAIQHELDHLNGVLLVDRMSPVKKVALSGKLKKLRRQAAER